MNRTATQYLKGSRVKKNLTPTCRCCGQPSNDLGACSGLCPHCQDDDVESLEQELGLEAGSLGRSGDEV